VPNTSFKMTGALFLYAQNLRFPLDELPGGTKVRYVSLRITLAIVLWSGAVGGGFAALARYKNTPGEPGLSPADWPAGTHVALARGRDTLLMFAHPQCPCTRASVAELARLMHQVGDRVEAHVLVLKPEGGEAGWEKTDVWTRSAEIPGVSVAADPDGREAARFGASTSGQVVLYDPGGRLLFRGGITGARGHEGDNAGRDHMAALIRTGSADARESRVFGCALFAPR
jgi:hypothetical protein